ncbi:bifunctional molybdopterin-guanine dinucleotide biosynthesis adaptor protein MobB/molybdopterin molybdotransferase MoeA [Aliiroseovarius subalbicans]|uniref:bifunctional molybdopterin-guanine dinucleotide biosynthesis adaptor protein MobB/molybdopterin molybdotransferase MoeA n=1 Tax=Aliiroseovarius subalbicans TaxID=2925840 RepID=UPI001F56221B|nr:bifunctional molybdopterin-guanine dinucleotide biosynthesis adaptor protein MobB/molybdopterin molybdotransferase MoeA [Aliiroseovarius subalbicans]MCI2399579.1 bifunctional molybdopterin-guanine dinucleotide biosynthesis adaptor protein MobB/molybdopterin molybdotransferase MoeA [Aliiroseovarius subalbicans]
MKTYGVIGWKNSGKTGLVVRLVEHFTARGLVVSTIKNSHHGADVDHEGTDSFRHRQAGAREVVLASSARVAQMHELRGEDKPTLDALVARLGPCDIVLVEGFKTESHPKIEAHRGATGSDLIAAGDTTVTAVASDHPLEDLTQPVFDLDDTAAIAEFILEDLGLLRSAPEGAPTGRLKNDCFALPPGVDWTPVDEARAMLRDRLSPVVAHEDIPVIDSAGRILARDAIALRSNPPGANSAVDGYGFAHHTLSDGDPVLPLVAGRSAAGAPFASTVPPGHAVRILTGALVPDGVDTVVLQEDVTLSDGQIAFAAGAKAGANTRRAGEDVEAGTTALSAGHLLRAPDLALLSAVGIARVTVHRRLRVGVLSTGDEIVPPGPSDNPAHTFDANRPMLLALAAGWGYEAVDLGHLPDDRDAIRGGLNDAAARVDVLLTSGGASAGEEDHVSALLSGEGDLTTWRIAIKPGRPLALALWQGVPVFGLPGNPVAALVTTLIFARPSLSVLAGGAWLEPQSFTLPAAFSKSKKPGRREYLRARMTADGRVERFRSEGSGLISGLSWAEGLVELGDDAQELREGDPVRFLPYAGFAI